MSALPGKVYEVCSEADLVLHSGDLTETDVIRDLERFAPLKAVRGNMDSLDVRRILPERLTLEIEGFRVCMAHGIGAPIGLDRRVLSWFRDQKPDIVVFGHSHVYQQGEKHGVMLLNPGSAAGRSGERTMAVLTLEKGCEPGFEKVTF
jgi:putative phosphoesterase